MKKTRLIGLLLLLAVLIPTASAVIPDGWTREDIERGYQLTEPVEIHTRVIYVAGASDQHWNGVRWVYNTPVVRSNVGNTTISVTIVHGVYTRTYTIRPKYCIVVYFPPVLGGGV